MAGPADDRRLVVVVFLRGGADGLTLVPPWSDPDYHDARPTIAVPEPGESGGALDLDGTFGLHPALAPLKALYDAGELAVVHAIGSDDKTRSHFDAQDRMERAADRGDGWLARHLQTRPGPAPGALSAVAVGASLPLSLQGVPAAAIESLAAYALDADGPYLDALGALWMGRTPLQQAGAQALEALHRVGALQDEPVDMVDGRFGDALADIVRLVRADVGLEVAHVDLGNWDSHFVQETVLQGLMTELGAGLAGFAAGLGTAWSRTTVVVLTEFGRRVYENTSLGTDHGRGGTAFVLGGAVRGGRVIADWPGLADGGHDAHDLRVTTDFRDVLAGCVAWAGNPDVERVFPGHRARPLGLFD